MRATQIDGCRSVNGYSDVVLKTRAGGHGRRVAVADIQHLKFKRYPHVVYSWRVLREAEEVKREPE